MKPKSEQKIYREYCDKLRISQDDTDIKKAIEKSMGYQCCISSIRMHELIQQIFKSLKIDLIVKWLNSKVR